VAKIMICDRASGRGQVRGGLVSPFSRWGAEDFLPRITAPEHERGPPRCTGYIKTPWSCRA